MSDTPSSRTVFISYTAYSGGERIFLNTTKELLEGEKLTKKWLEEKELEIALKFPSAKILSWETFEDEETPTLKTFLFIYSYEGSSPQIKEYSTTTSTEALELFESESDINKTIVNEPRNGWWMISELIFRRSHFFPHSATDIR